MSRGRRDVLRDLTILLVSGSTMTKLLVRSLLTKISPVFLVSPAEGGAATNAIINPNVSSFGISIGSPHQAKNGPATKDFLLTSSARSPLDDLIAMDFRRSMDRSLCGSCIRSLAAGRRL